MKRIHLKNNTETNVRNYRNHPKIRNMKTNYKGNLKLT